LNTPDIGIAGAARALVDEKLSGKPHFHAARWRYGRADLAASAGLNFNRYKKG
jgi:hypothetical protein